jgi:hypothetical protein
MADIRVGNVAKIANLSIEVNPYGEIFREELVQSAIKSCHRDKWLFPWSGWFTICPISKVAPVLGVITRNSAYIFLESLHCVNYRAIPKPIRQKLPALIREALTPGVPD